MVKEAKKRGEKDKKTEKRRVPDIVTREYNINLHKRLHGVSLKKRAPRAIREIRGFATKAMGTKDVRIDVRLNKEIWSSGIRSVPRRVRVKLARRPNEDEDSKEKLFTLVTLVGVHHPPKMTLKGLLTTVVDDK
eukprot:TRINITY_DN36323_c0_g1_i1.p1 TRINITY_DN36323_c0_g1~~TRINITY_DN36323_c0_g1_i1.p1  ORF type:complete len:134 (-),score=37.50 TRINITY_DN36323_c0_g1_i1:84-485(-)